MKITYLRTERQRQGLTQEELEAKSGVLQKTISKLETTTGVNPTFDTVVKIASALGVDPRSLRFGPDPRAERKSA